MKGEILGDGKIRLTAETNAESAYLKTLAPNSHHNLMIREWCMQHAASDRLGIFTFRIEEGESQR